MGVLSIPALAFAAAGSMALAYLGAAYLWRLLVSALAYSLALGA